MTSTSTQQFLCSPSSPARSPMARPYPAARSGLELSDWLNISPYHPAAFNSPSNDVPATALALEEYVASAMVSSAERLFASNHPALAKNTPGALDSPVFRQDGSFLFPPSPLPCHPPSTSPLSSQLTDETTLPEASMPDLLHHHDHSYASQSPYMSTHYDTSSLPATPELFDSMPMYPRPTISPVVRPSQGDSTPVTTISDQDDTQSTLNQPQSPISASKAETSCAAHDQDSKENAVKRTFLERLNNNTSPFCAKTSFTPSRVADNRSPLCLNSPFQLGGFFHGASTPIPSSPLSQLTNQPDLPPDDSRPQYSASTRPAKRFKPSLLIVNLTPSSTDTFTQKNVRAFEEDGHRYRTRSKLRSLRAEIEAHEKDMDLGIIRNFLKKEDEAPREILGRTRRQTKVITDASVFGRPKCVKEEDAKTSSAATSRLTSPAHSVAGSEVSPSKRKVQSTLRRTANSASSKRAMDDDDFPSPPRSPAKKARRNETPATAKSFTASSSPSTAAVTTVIPQSTNSNGPPPPVDYPYRTFPPTVPVNARFPLMYRRFPLCSYLDPDNKKYPKPTGPSPNGLFNTPRTVYDLYTPRFVKGIGRDKVGMCPICFETRERGGAGKTEWLSMKFSAFKCYHMQYAHGISPTTTLPFSPPVEFRTIQRQPSHKNEKAQLLEGKCHKCTSWIPMEGIKCVEAKLKEIYWWKHAAACHKGSTLEGETDVYLEDDVSRAIFAIAGLKT